ncbi:hypothetical protein C9374_005490 [Naegleria lovaniensis]|uniref:Uncharacterized protein n=1 Tax=Naegleria lovaniensis TaxID=51637 RepID=A0AA88GQG6_NAELO|nr:uncharacterized protein C9374_005490 [Naegleria lovaniensis]KAG2382288.1 hypothetical protein C9374_005490 [Naegleria lovaniensis]
MSGEAFGLFSSAMKEKKSSKSKSRASSFANVMLEIEPLIKVQPADDGTLSDFINEFKQADELPQGLSSKTKAFHVFEPEYYINRVKGIESEMVDAIRRRMVPDAKRKITQHVNTYNVLSCDKLEWKVLIAKLEKSAAPESKKVLSYRVRDRGLEAGSTRKGKKYEVSWQNNSPNTFLPVLDNDRYWWGYAWEHMSLKWRAMTSKTAPPSSSKTIAITITEIIILHMCSKIIYCSNHSMDCH